MHACVRPASPLVRALLGALAASVAALALTLPGVDPTWSAYSATAASAGSHFATAATYSTACPASYPTATWLSGAEHGSAGGMWTSARGTAPVADTSVVRSGAYSLKVATAGTNQYRGGIMKDPGSVTYAKVMVARFAIRFDTLPTGDVTELFGAYSSSSTNTNGSTLRLGYKASTQRLTLRVRSTTNVLSTPAEASVPVTAGTWHVIDVRYDLRATPHTADWRIDGVAQTPTSVASAASNVMSYFWGTWQTTDTYTAFYDDMLVTQDNTAHYPLQDSRVYGLRPDGMGTSVGTANFVNNDGSALGASSWTRLDDLPMEGNADHVRQTATSTTSYAELTFDDTTQSCVGAVLARVSWETPNSTNANHGKTSIFDGATESVVWSATMSGTGTVMRYVDGVVTPASARWTPAALNGLRGRIGYSSDAAPAPQWHALHVEYDVPQ
jgi:hypothetical protein